jgi:hypothetical protein
MCLALYIAGEHPLPIVDPSPVSSGAKSAPDEPGQAESFLTAELRPEQVAARAHFSSRYVLYAGGSEGCACVFNYGRQYPDLEDDEAYRAVAREVVAALVRYVADSQVQEIYGCCFGDEGQQKLSERTVTPATLRSPSFFFRERELLRVEHDGEEA